jgi:hypothetical protein
MKFFVIHISWTFGIFCGRLVCQFSAKHWRFSKTYPMLKFLQKLAVVRAKKRQYFRQFFWGKIFFFNRNIGPRNKYPYIKCRMSGSVLFGKQTTLPDPSVTLTRDRFYKTPFRPKSLVTNFIRKCGLNYLTVFCQSSPNQLPHKLKQWVRRMWLFATMTGAQHHIKIIYQYIVDTNFVFNVTKMQ